MNNAEKMVSEDLIRAILGNAAQGYFSKDHGDQLRKILDQPAQQHQDEPIMLTAVATLVDDGDGGLAPSWLLEGGTAELFSGMTLLVADNAPDLCSENGSAKLYTHTDPVEVERLRDELDGYKQGSRVEAEEADTLRAQLAEASQTVEQLRKDATEDALRHSDMCEKLAEAHALLRRAKMFIRNGVEADQVVADILAALSASAEPSAPVEIDERAEFEKWWSSLTSVDPYTKGEHWDAWQARAALERKQQKTPQ